MNSEFKKLISHPKFIVTGLMVLSTVFVISLMFPKGGGHTYDLQTGAIWSDDDLYADKDYFIWKTANELDADQDVIRRDFKPVFRRVLEPTENADYWSGLIEANREELKSDAYDDMRQFVSELRKKEVLRKADLSFQGSEYQQIRLREDEDLTVLESGNYVTNDRIKLRMAPVLTVATEGTQLDRVTIALDRDASRIQLEKELDGVRNFKKQIRRGDLIVARGEIITDETLELLRAVSLDGAQGTRAQTLVFAGLLLLTCLILGTLVFYLYFHFVDVLKSTRKMGFLLGLIVLFSFLVFSIDAVDNLSSYLIPFCIVPIVVKSFFNDRLALFTHIVIILIASILSRLGYEFTFLQILAGIVAVLFIEDIRSWNKFFISILSIIGAYFIGYLGLSLIEYAKGQAIDWTVYRWLGISGILTLLAYPFIPLIAKLFGFVSIITLAELGDLNRPLLKRLGLEAPGTLQHSLQVANLSEAAAESIGANAMLLKVGALYHDIGKLHNPAIFVENQRGMNPHDNMTNFESARAIIDHVTEGVKMAVKASLPADIIDLIRTHHGTTRVEYFYRNQVNKFPDKEFDESLFRYPGPKPQSKEQSILMIADSLEAASKSLQNPSINDIDALVDKIVDYKISNNQFDESSLTFQELESCVNVFKSLLKNIYHVRIQYPEEVVRSNS